MYNDREMEELNPVKIEDEHLLPHQQQHHHHHRQDHIPTSFFVNLYLGHFLARWGARTWEFSVGLYMINIWPDSLLMAAAYGVVECASTTLFGPLVGQWIDNSTYPKMADVARGHGGDTYGRGPPGGGPPDDDRSWQPPRQCEVSDDSGSGSGSGRGQGKRGKTTLQGMRKRNPQGNLLTIEFEQGTHNTYKPVGVNQATFASLVGTLVDKFPQNYKSWRKIPAELKATIWPDLQMYFDMTPHEGLRAGIEKYAANRYKDHKYRFKQKHFSKIGGEDRVDISDVVPPDMQESEWKGYVDYYTSPEVKARSATNKSNKGKQAIKGHGGRTSLAQCRYMFREEGSDEPGSAILAYRRFYTDSSGNFYQPEPAAYYEQMVALQQQHPEMSEKQIMRQVLGERPGWERGIGPIPSVPSQPSPPPHRTDQRMFSQSEVEEMIAARLASEQEQWQSQMMANMMAQMQSQIQTQVQSALKRSGHSQQDDEDEEDDEGGSS